MVEAKLRRLVERLPLLQWRWATVFAAKWIVKHNTMRLESFRGVLESMYPIEIYSVLQEVAAVPFPKT